jgi:hypothetical protein
MDIKKIAHKDKQDGEATFPFLQALNIKFFGLVIVEIPNRPYSSIGSDCLLAGLPVGNRRGGAGLSRLLA